MNTNNSNIISKEDKALYRSICESYTEEEISKFFEEFSLNEHHFTSAENPEFYAGTTPGTTDKGVKGLVKALPSAIISCILCPSAALIAALGAVRNRFEQKFTRSLFNADRWLDFIGSSKETKQNLVEKVKKEVAEHTKYFMARLANGEVIRVVACHKHEAKDMAIAIEDELIINQERQFSLLSDPEGKEHSKNVDNDDAIWVITFNDGEIQYWQANKNANKQAIIKEANKQRQLIADGFAKKFKQITGKKLQGIGDSYEREYEPIKVATVDNIEVLDSNVKIDRITDFNKSKIEIYEGDRLSSNLNLKNNLIWFTLNSRKIGNTGRQTSPIIRCSLPVQDKEDLEKVVKEFFYEPTGYYQSKFLNTLTQIINTNFQDESLKKISLYQYSYMKNSYILLPYIEADNNDMINLVYDMFTSFKEYLRNSEDLDKVTKSRIEKYLIVDSEKYVIQQNPKKHQFGEILYNKEDFIQQYKDVFNDKVTVSYKDEQGNIQNDIVDLQLLAA